MFCVTCSGHGPSVFFSNNNKPIYKKSLCDPEKNFPQMILIPFFEGATQLVPNCKVYPKYKTAIALFVFYHKWDEYFGDRDYAVKGMLEKVMIVWGIDKKISSGYDIEGEKFENHNVIGLVESDTVIWVWKGYDNRISQSALFHELVHLALIAKYGHADTDHEGMKYRGWRHAHSVMIIEAKEMLRAFDL
jgi:hypothetical protein